MDYEKKYNDAIKYLKAFLDGDCVTHSEIIADFPELAESEDERIRKNLCEFIHDTIGDELNNYDITKQEVLAWLEKQKEQMPLIWRKQKGGLIRLCAPEIERYEERHGNIGIVKYKILWDGYEMPFEELYKLPKEDGQ